MKIVDCKGLVCPMPLIETKKAIKEAKRQLKIDCGLDENETYGNTLYYSVKELFNK